MQDKGFCVIAHKLNNMIFRFIIGSVYFAEMKTTIAKKHLP
jgi:hypothetical protein